MSCEADVYFAQSFLEYLEGAHCHFSSFCGFTNMYWHREEETGIHVCVYRDLVSSLLCLPIMQVEVERGTSKYHHNSILTYGKSAVVFLG